jgi:hypothetical protein
MTMLVLVDKEKKKMHLIVHIDLVIFDKPTKYPLDSIYQSREN